MRKGLLFFAPAVLLFACESRTPTPLAPADAALSPQLARMANGRGAAGVVFVRSQGLYYDTYATAESLPMKGKFQLLDENGETEYGPGDPGYRGGRWWVDVNGDGIQNVGDRFFLCPLLPPGRTSP